MKLEVTPVMLLRLSESLVALDRRAFVVVADALADIGLIVSPRDDGGFEFETVINRANRLVAQELMKCATK